VRSIPRFLGSTESAFGFRVACATLTVGVIAFLKDTQAFFIEQRLVWAMIIIAIGMTMTSGQVRIARASHLPDLLCSTADPSGMGL
jgi:hypothetical protein